MVRSGAHCYVYGYPERFCFCINFFFHSLGCLGFVNVVGALLLLLLSVSVLHRFLVHDNDNDKTKKNRFGPLPVP